MAKKAKKKLGCPQQPLNGETGDYAKEVGKAVIPKVIGWGAGIGAAYFLVIKPVLEAVGIKKTDADKKNDEATNVNATTLNSAFNPNYYKSIPNATLLTSASAKALATKIHDAIGFLTDDENAVLGVFRQLKFKTQVSFIASVFYQLFGEDLYIYISRNMKSDIKLVNDIVANLK
jgi:hypothetical protein